MLKKFLEDQSGATAIEYGLIVSVLSLAIVAGVANFGNTMSNMFVDASSTLDAN